MMSQMVLFGQKKKIDTTYTTNKHYTKEELLADYNFMISCLREAHPGLYLYNDTAYMDQLEINLRHQIDTSKTEAEFYALASSYIGDINCSHTSISPSKEYYWYISRKETFLPLVLDFQERKGIVRYNLTRDTTIIEGDELIGVNESSMQEILDSILPRINSDGSIESFKYKRLSRSFHYFLSRQ